VAGAHVTNGAARQVAQANAGDGAVIDQDALATHAGNERGAALDGLGQQRVVRAVLGIGRAGEADAVPAADTRGAAAARHRVDQQRRCPRRPAERVGARLEPVTFCAHRERGHRIAALPRPLHTVRRRVAGHPDLPLGAVVERLELVVGDRPVGERRGLGHAEGGRQTEVVGLQPPRHALVDARATADGHGDVVPPTVPRVAHDGSVEHPRLRVWPRVVTVLEQAVVAHVIDVGVVGEQLSAVDGQHASAVRGEDRRRDAATGTGAHDDHVVVLRDVAPRRGPRHGEGDRRSRLARRSFDVAEPDPRRRPATAVVRLRRQPHQGAEPRLTLDRDEPPVLRVGIQVDEVVTEPSETVVDRWPEARVAVTRVPLELVAHRGGRGVGHALGTRMDAGEDGIEHGAGMHGGNVRDVGRTRRSVACPRWG
jgi:hypothetical protein